MLDIRYLIMIIISYILSDTLLPKPWYLHPITCYLLLANCYLSFDTYWNLPFYSFYVVLVILNLLLLAKKFSPVAPVVRLALVLLRQFGSTWNTWASHSEIFIYNEKSLLCGIHWHFAHITWYLKWTQSRKNYFKSECEPNSVWNTLRPPVCLSMLSDISVSLKNLNCWFQRAASKIKSKGRRVWSIFWPLKILAPAESLPASLTAIFALLTSVSLWTSSSP